MTIQATALSAILCLNAALLAQVPAWQPTTVELSQQEKPGFGKLCGVVIDPASGDLTINLGARGLYRSTDPCKSWKRLGDKRRTGRTETPGCPMLDPTGRSKKLGSALVYGSPIIVSPAAGQSSKPLHAKS